MLVNFIAHAGFYVESKNGGIIFDPWFMDSTFDNPILHGVLPKAKTIDFQIPKCNQNIDRFNPFAICISHFHTHHSPLNELIRLISNSKFDRVLLLTPSLTQEQHSGIVQNLKSVEGRYLLVPHKSPHSPIEIRDWKISMHDCTGPGHIIYKVESPTGKFVHMADAMINQERWSRSIDPLFAPLRDYQPDFLAISAAGHCTDFEGRGSATFYENSSLSPQEASRLCAYIRPKAAGLMGIYNSSIWTARLEYSYPPRFAESYFQWALDHLSPETKVALLRPGMEISFNSGNETAA